MRSLKQFTSENINYYNNLSAFTSSDYNNVPLTETLLVKKYGKSIDSVLYKLDLCSYRQNNNNFILENSNDVLFTIDEQYASRDLLILTCKSYIESLCEEYGIDIPILEESDSITNISSFISKVQNTIKNKTDQVKTGLKEVGDKIKAIKEFLNKIISKAIKSGKELVDKFLELMLAIKDSLTNIFKKLGGQIEEIQKEYTQIVEEVIKDKSKRPKENIYENLQNEIINRNINEENIFELFGLGKKKKEDNEKDPENKNEYDKSLEGGKGSEEKKGGKGKLLLSILKQVAISVTVLILIPAIIGCAWGPAAGMIAATIAKAIMTGYGFWRLCKNIYLTIKSGKFKKATKWGKLGYIFLWIVSIALLAWGAQKAGADIKKCWEAFSDGNLKQLVPDETIQGAMKLINKVWKSLTGNDTAGYEELVKLTSEGGVIDQWEKLEETKDKTNDAFQAKELKNLGDTNDWNNIEQNLGKEVSDQLKSAADASLKSSKSVQDAFINAVDGSKIPTDTHVVFVDGDTAAKMIRTGLMNGADGAKVAINQVTNTALQSATHGQAGTMFMVVVKGSKEAAQDLLSSAAKEAGVHGVDFLGKIISGSATETVIKLIPHHLPLISGGFAPIVGLPAVFKKKVNKGFLLRLGSSRSGNNIYVIKEDGIKGMKFSELESKYGDKNSSVINGMKKIINNNYKTLENAKDKLESKSNLDKKEKKLLNSINKQIEKMKDGIDDYECLVFYSDKVVEATNKETNEGLIDKLFKKGEKPKEKDIEYIPIMFINPICMACGDLADSTKKRGPRKNPIYIKGLFASYEFLPGSEGMNENDIDKMLTDIALDCLKTAWNMTADAPCIKKAFKNYKENEDSIYKGQEREDFGKFTNAEITEIFNDPSTISKYMGGQHSKRSTVEKENTESQKERKENAKKEWKNNIENNEEVNKLLDEMPKLKKQIKDEDGKVKPEALDDLTDAFLRMETNYNKGKSKKSIWGKIKNFFFGDDNEDTKKYDPEEVQKLAYKLASLHKEKLKSKKNKKEDKETNESLEEIDYNINCFEMNMEDLLSEEFIYFLQNDEIYENELNNSIELIEE